jgi:hypothetical protein
MLLGKPFAAFVAKSPVSVIVQGTLERVFDPQKLEQVFDNHAVAQYTKELTFADCVGLMSDVVFRVSPSVGAWYKTHQEEMPVSRQAVYDKLKHLELPVSAALVRYSATTLLPVVREMANLPPPFLAGYRVRVLDGNHLAGTEHRLPELRRHRAAALPGQTLVFYDPQLDLVTNVIPCEDAHAQERSLLARVLEGIAAQDCVLGDRNFCTLGFLFGIHRQGGFFIIRQHASLPYQLLGRRRRAGQDGQQRAVYEQAVCLIDPHTGETHVVRRITIALLKPTKQGDTELHVLTNLPPEDAEAVQVADRYADRWTIAVSSEGHILQSVEVRPRLKDSGLVAWEAPWRESKTAEPSDNVLEIEYRQSTRLQRAVNAGVASLHAIPVAETVDNVRRQQGLGEMSPTRQPSPAGYQRRHGTKEDGSTGEARGARRGKLVEEMSPITVSGKWRRRRPGGGSGRSTVDRRATKRARREGPGPVSTPLVKVRQG